MMLRDPVASTCRPWLVPASRPFATRTMESPSFKQRKGPQKVLNILDRMRELAVQSHQTLDNGERAYLDDEFEQLSTKLNGLHRRPNSRSPTCGRIAIFT